LPRINYDRWGSEKIQQLLADWSKAASAFIVQESFWSAFEFEVILYLPSRGRVRLGEVCIISVRRQDLPALVRMVEQTQGLSPMSAKQWQVRVVRLTMAKPTQ
jgi:hypothetical protein